MGFTATMRTLMSKKPMKVLVTGGAGYIGSVLVRQLLEQNFQVRVIDSLLHGGESLADLLNDQNFEFIKGDVRNRNDVKKALERVNAVAHLAAIVGDPACAKEPELAEATNLHGSKLLYEEANSAGVDRFIFASTCSNYGRMSDPTKLVDEDSPLAPVSLYAKTKVEVEKHLLSSAGSCSPTCLRFSTVYGLSPRLRFDLTVNEFAKDAALNRELVIFGEQFWRPYCHVTDLARSVIACLNAPKDKVSRQVFNVGDTRENYQKKMLVDELLKILPDVKVKYVAKVEDPRDYRVSFAKISEHLGFSVSKRVPEGLSQIVRSIREGLITDPDSSKYSNI
jgi:nucleoside-diphosphate-sugar epimerase